MSNNDVEDILTRKEVKPTSNRILVMRELIKASHPVSLADLEISLGFSMDKASIFRVLELFSEKLPIPWQKRGVFQHPFWQSSRQCI